MAKSRIVLKEVSIARVGGAVARRAADLPERLAWLMSAPARASRERMQQFENKHAGETCVILCNGPSLNKTDLSLTKGLPTFCMNRSYLMFDEWQFIPTYFVAIAEQVLTQFADDIVQLPMPKFVDFKYRDLYPISTDTAYLRLPPRFNDAFAHDLTMEMSSGGTVTYATLQLAYYMGFTKAVIVGMDHRFSQKGVPNTTEVRTETTDPDHMHPNYFPKGMRWGLPDLVRSEIAYELAREAYTADGREIIDATVGGACQVFKKMELADALVVEPQN